MSSTSVKPKTSGLSDIQWHLLDDNKEKMNKSSGLKIEYSMSDEIEFAQKLSIQMRKKQIRELLQIENFAYQQELNSIGRLHSRDTVCAEVRKCGGQQMKFKPNYVNNAQVSQLGKLFKIYED